MPKRVAAKRVSGEKDHVEDYQRSAEADPETTCEVERDHGVVPEEADLHDRRVKGKAVEVVEDPRKCSLAAVAPTMRLRHRAGARVPQERSKVSLAVVVARESKGERRPRHPHARWDA